MVKNKNIRTFADKLILKNQIAQIYCMKEMTLTDIQGISLEIMKELHSFCMTNDLKYSMGYGTLLGAVRHKGFIPWDDDIDVVMLRSDYDKFCKAWEDSHEYKLFSYERGNMYAACARLCEMEKTFVKTQSPLFTERTGVWIDIFPLDYIDENHDSFLQRNHLIKKAHLDVFMKRYSMIKKESSIFNVKSDLKWIARKIIYHKNVMKLVGNHVQLCKSFSPPSNRVCCISFPTYLDRDFTPIWLFDSYVELPFEDSRFMAMKGYDEYLHGLYGNYMELPPKDKQIRAHCVHEYYWL